MKISGAVMEANSVWDLLFFKPKLKQLNMCIPAFMQMDKMSQFGPVWILGMPFFRYYHSTFDRRPGKEPEIHFATATEKCDWEPYKNPAAAANKAKTEAEKKKETPDATLAAIRAVVEEARDPEDLMPESVDIDAIVPPTLSSLLDDGQKYIDL